LEQGLIEWEAAGPITAGNEPEIAGPRAEVLRMPPVEGDVRSTGAHAA